MKTPVVIGESKGSPADDFAVRVKEEHVTAQKILMGYIELSGKIEMLFPNHHPLCNSQKVGVGRAGCICLRLTVDAAMTDTGSVGDWLRKRSFGA